MPLTTGRRCALKADDADAWTRLAVWQGMLNRLDEAAASIDRALALAPDYQFAQRVKALIARDQAKAR